MASQPRRPTPNYAPQQYAAVPQSPRAGIPIPQQRPSYVTQQSGGSHLPQASSRSQNPMQSGRGAIAQGVATGAIGAGYGPYSYKPTSSRDNGMYANSRFSAAPSDASTTPEDKPGTGVGNSSTVPAYLWDTKDPDLDDALHNPDPIRDAVLDRSFTIFSARGWMNVTALVLLVGGLLTLFAGYPIITFYRTHRPPHAGFNLGGINGTGQIPVLPGLPTMIDADTDPSVFTRTGTDGKKYNLVFSDEFNIDGRTFWPGDDPYWEAQDMHYWPTGDLEWYEPQAITTENGKLVITITEEPYMDLNFRSGMLTSWNKMCFTTGYVEVSISMPGSPRAPGLWPGAWAMGNLGRAGYGATTEGMWPYSYDACDVGTFPNQTAAGDTTGPEATGGLFGNPLSFLPGQRLSSCTCPGSDHPGPSVTTGRGVPEIDIIETQIDTDLMQGQVSQSFQTAPFNFHYVFDNTTPPTTIYDSSVTKFNTYTGGPFQQALSAVTYIDSQFYNDTAYAPYAFEWWSDPSNRDDGYITWFSNAASTWTLTSASVGPDSTMGISSRLIPEEPMYLIFNLGLSPSFQPQDWMHLQFPSKMYIDYVRVYQRQGVKNGVTCDPPQRPTAEYINNHPAAYSDANLTTWAQANGTFPRNSLYDGC